jgi:hypothetical protein
MIRTACLVAALLVLGPAWVGEAQVVESVRITAPPLLTFDVADVDVVTYASGGVFTVSFDQAVLRQGRAVRISVRGEGDLTPPAGAPVVVTSLSWTTSSASNGVGVNGTLSKSQYRTVFESLPGASAGRVDVTWSLDLGNRNVRAGTHTGLLRWRIETFLP